MNIPAMCTGEMKYVILRIDTHVLRIDLCPRKRTRIRRQKQDEDVHLFLSERPLPRQGSWRGTRPNSPASADAPEAPESVKQVVSRFPRPRKGSNKLFQGFRRVGKAQASCFKVSEASGRQGRRPSLPPDWIKNIPAPNATLTTAPRDERVNHSKAPEPSTCAKVRGLLTLSE